VTNLFAYDGFGRQTAATDGRGHTRVTLYDAFDAFDRISATADCLGIPGTLTINYSLLTVNSPLLTNATHYARDIKGRTTAATDAPSHQQSAKPTAQPQGDRDFEAVRTHGARSGIPRRSGNRNTVHTAYDEADNVTAQWGAICPAEYTYDAFNRRTAMRTFRSALADADTLPAEWPGGDLTQWHYDNATGLCTNKAYADGSSVADASGATAFTRHLDGSVSTERFQSSDAVFTLHESRDPASGLPSGYALSRSNALTGASAVLNARTFTRDALARLAKAQRVRPGTAPAVRTDTFAHNARPELVHAATGTNALGYLYDGIGSRGWAAENAAANLYAANGLNPYTSVSTFVPFVPPCEFIPAFDTNGNQTLIRTATAVWDLTEPAATRPLLLQTPSGWYTCGFDQVKNVTELFDASGNIAASYDYAPFGEDMTAAGPAAALNPFRFSSEAWDAALGLVCYTFRPYNPLDGRFINCDPIEEQGGLNLYGFVGNDPVNRTDYLGWMAMPWGAEPSPFAKAKDRLKRQLKDICPTSKTPLKKDGRNVCCDPEDCKKEAEQMAESYINALQNAYRMRKVSFGGYWGNACVILANGYYKGPSCYAGQDYGDVDVGLTCGGWASMAEAVLQGPANKSNCWNYKTELKDPNWIERKILGDGYSPHMWSSLQIMDGAKIHLDPYYSGGKSY
jgi:RHS repeat-associated protein